MPTKRQLEQRVKRLGKRAERLRYSTNSIAYRDARKAYLLAQAELYPHLKGETS